LHATRTAKIYVAIAVANSVNRLDKAAGGIAEKWWDAMIRRDSIQQGELQLTEWSHLTGDMLPVARRLVSYETVGILAVLVTLEGCGSGADNSAAGQGPGSGTDNPVVDAGPGGGQPSDDAGQAGSVDAGMSTTVSTAGDAAGAGASASPVDSGSLDLDANPGATADAGSTTMNGGDGGASPADECAGGMTGAASDSPSAKAQVSGNGSVQFTISTQTQITDLRTTLAVPTKPSSQAGTLFVWPGLQPLQNGPNFAPIGNGVLQPVLTWGPTCAAGAPSDYTTWWISGEYVNTFSYDPGINGCHGGQGMDVTAGDLLDIDMALSGTMWKQTITDRQTNKTVDFTQDLMGQDQGWAIFDIESDGVEPVSDVIFTSTTITMAAADPSGCEPSVRGQNDYFAAPRISNDGKTCCISKIILRGQGVAATSPNTP
jgi:hypothetical protein